MATLGRDADVLLYHASLNGGAAIGFLLDAERGEKGVVIERTNWYNSESGSWIERVKITLALVLSPQLTNPDGSVRNLTMAQEYANYLALRGLVTGIGLNLSLLGFTGLHISAHASKERHTNGRIEIDLVLNSGNWPESVKFVTTAVIVEPTPTPVVEAGSWWFDQAIQSGLVVTI